MTNWITDEHGNQTFTHGGWTVRIWSPGITCPSTGTAVEVATTSGGVRWSRPATENGASVG